MNAKLFASLAAASLLAATGAHAATERQLHDFLDHAHQSVQTSLDSARVNLAQRVVVSGYVAPNGRIEDVRLSASSGSPVVDAQVAEAIRHVRFTHVPADMGDAKLTIFLDPSGPTFAKVD
jgi:TonB family protein